MPPNLAAKSTQIRAKRDPNTKPSCIIFSIPCLIDFGRLLDRILVGFGCQVGRPRHPKSLKTYYVFSILATSANLPTRGYMIDFLINLALNLTPKIHQKSTSEAPKIDCRGHRQHDASWHGFWIQLGRQLGPNFAQLGPTWLQLGPTWLQLGPNMLPTWRNLVPNWTQDGPT